MKPYAVALAASVLSASVSSASAATAYKCDMSSKGFGGFIGDVMIFILDPATAQGMVFDGVIKSVSDKPIAAQVTKRKDTIWRYTWAVEHFRLGNGGSATVKMRATLNTQTGAVSVNGNLSGYDNNISGAGKCSIIK